MCIVALADPAQGSLCHVAGRLRCGGPFTASVLVNGLQGLLGFGLALAVLHLAAARMSAAPALLIALAVAVGWNAMLTLLGRRRFRRAPGPPG